MVTNVQSHIILLFLIKRYRAIESIYHKTFTNISNKDSGSNSDQPGISGPLEVIIIVIMNAKNKPFYPAVSVVSIWSQKPCQEYTRIYYMLVQSFRKPRRGGQHFKIREPSTALPSRC